MEVAGRHHGFGTAGECFYGCRGWGSGELGLLMFQPGSSFPSIPLEAAAGHVRSGFFSDELHPWPEALAGWVQQLNRIPNPEFEQCGLFFTLFAGVVDPKRRELAYVNAGHTAPFLRRVRDGSIERLDSNYPAMGIVEVDGVESACVPWEAGDLLLCANDGILEVESEHRESFGEQRVADLLSSPATAQAAIDTLFQGLSDFGSPWATQPAALAVRFSDRPRP